MTLTTEQIRDILEGAPEGVLMRHQNTDRNRALNKATCKISDVINNHDPEIDIPIKIEVWDCLDDATAAIEAPLYREILTLRQRVDELEAQQSEVAARAFRDAKIPTKAKAGCMGDFSFTVENANCCPECWHEKDDECELCSGESDENGMGDLEVQVPWDLQKKIWLRMNNIYANQLRKGEGDD